MKKIPMIIFCMLFTILISACGGGDVITNQNPTETEKTSEINTTPSKVQNLTFGAVPIGGFWYLLAATISNEVRNYNPDYRIAVMDGGAISNLLAVDSGQFELGFTTAQTMAQGLKGIQDFENKKVENARWIASMFENKLVIAVKANSDIYSIKDLQGKRISPGIKGFTTEVILEKVLEVNGLSYEDMARVEYVGTGAGFDLMRDGHIDAVSVIGSSPLPGLQEFEAMEDVRLIPLTDETINEVSEYFGGLSGGIIPAEDYSSVNEDTRTVVTYTMLVGNKNLSEELVYDLTKIIVENAEKWKNVGAPMNDFSGQFSIERKEGQIHPGAEKYYKEVGLLE